MPGLPDVRPDGKPLSHGTYSDFTWRIIEERQKRRLFGLPVSRPEGHWIDASDKNNPRLLEVPWPSPYPSLWALYVAQTDDRASDWPRTTPLGKRAIPERIWPSHGGGRRGESVTHARRGDNPEIAALIAAPRGTPSPMASPPWGAGDRMLRDLGLPFDVARADGPAPALTQGAPVQPAAPPLPQPSQADRQAAAARAAQLIVALRNAAARKAQTTVPEIGRASCRERV